MGIAELNKHLNQELGLYEFNYCYAGVESGGARSERKRYHFRVRAAQRELVQFLPSSGKGVDNVIVRVSGPWKFGDLLEEVLPPLRCPRVPGKIGRSQLSRKGFLFYLNPPLPKLVLTRLCLILQPILLSNRKSLKQSV